MCDDFAGAIEFADALREIAQRDEVAAEIADLIFVRLANIEDVEIVAAIEARFQIARSDFGDGCLRRGSFFTANAAELGVVNQLGDGAVCAAERAIGIFAQLQFAEAHGERIEKQQAADEMFAHADDELQRLGRLNRADDSRQHAQHAAFGAGRNEARRRRLGIQAAVAGAVWVTEDCYLAFEAKNGAVDVGLAEQHATRR